VQVYYSMPLSALVRYHLRLLAFAKTDVLAPQQAVVLAIAAPAEAFAPYDPALGALTVEAGAYTVSVGASSADISGTASITLAAAVFGEPAPAASALAAELSAFAPETWLKEKAALTERAERAERFKSVVKRDHRRVHDEAEAAMERSSALAA